MSRIYWWYFQPDYQFDMLKYSVVNCHRDFEVYEILKPKFDFSLSDIWGKQIYDYWQEDRCEYSLKVDIARSTNLR